MAKSAPYFSHDYNARNDERIIRLRMKYGSAGYGLYWMLVERLAEASDYISSADYDAVAFELRVESSLIKSVVEDFGLFSFTEDRLFFYSESLNRRLKMKTATSEKRKEAIRARWSAKEGSKEGVKTDTKSSKSDTNVIQMYRSSDTNVIQMNAKSDTSKVKEIKVKEITPPTPSKGDECDFGFEEIWTAYGRKGNKKTSLRKWLALKNHCRSEAIKHVPLYVAATPEEQYRKNFETYLNHEAWNDKLPENRPLNNKQNATKTDNIPNFGGMEGCFTGFADK